MRQWTTLGRLALYAVLVCVCAFSQEPYEDRAARLQPQDIPPLIEKAQAGDRPSQVLLWLAYSGGHGVPKDAKKGVPYLRMAAEQGSIEAEFVLGTLYHFGQAGVAVNDAESFKWALKAAKGGHPVAQHNVATDYFTGTGVTKDEQQALYWYQRAAEQGFAHSGMEAGRDLLRGNRRRAESRRSAKVAEAVSGTGTCADHAHAGGNVHQLGWRSSATAIRIRSVSCRSATWQSPRRVRGRPHLSRRLPEWAGLCASESCGFSVLLPLAMVRQTSIWERCTKAGKASPWIWRRRAAITSARPTWVSLVRCRSWVRFIAMAAAWRPIR